MNRFSLRKSFDQSSRSVLAFALACGLLLMQMPTFSPASARSVAASSLAAAPAQCTAVTTLPPKGSFFGFGDANGCQITGGPGKTYPANQPEVFLYGKFNAGTDQTGKPPVFFSPQASGFNGPQGTRDVALGILDFGNGSTAERLAIVDIPTQARATPQLPSTVYAWGQLPGGPWTLIGTWTYPANCVDAASTAVPLSPVASVQRGAQQAPPGMNVNQVNPRPVLFSTGVPVNSGPSTATAPARVHSWASGMTWANNDPAAKYYQGGLEWKPRQTPIWADPLIAWYSNQPKNARGNYIDPNWITQDVGTGTGKNAVFAPGFHLSTATPALTSGNVYSATTTENSYNYNGRAKHGASTVQVGLDQIGVWRETIAVFPASNANPFDPVYYPNNPATVAQGDWDIVFRASNPANAASYLQMAVAQGSPFAQFSAENTEAATIAAAYLPGYTQGNGAQAGGITAPVDFGGLRYQIIYQQVNAMDVNAESYPAAMKSNWVSFAVLWDPTKLTAKSLTAKTNPADGMTYYSLPLDAQPSYFVVAALPNQMVNNVTPSDTATPYDAQAADVWAKELTKSAFNYYTGKSALSFFVGKKRDGSAAPSNQVNVYYDPNVTAFGPAAAGQTTFLLQPHQYSDKFKDGRNAVRPVNATQPFPACATCGGMKAWTAADKNKYWIARGKLEAYTDTALSLTYIAPPMLPYFPSNQLAQDPDRAGAGQNESINFHLNDLAYGLVSGQAYPLVIDNPPAGSKLGLGQINDPYGVGTSLYAASKLLHTLNGLSEPAKIPDWYSKAQIRWFKKSDMQSALYTQITNLFGYYFSTNICQVGQDGLNSYVYAYYDDASHHLLLYPTGTPGKSADGKVDGNIGQPQSYGPGVNVIDAFGIGSKLSDNSYAYGYYVNAAALLAIALQQNAIPGLTPEQQKWWDKDHIGPAIDLLIKDIAYADKAGDAAIPWWTDQQQLAFPRLEFMDLWTGVAYADAFTSRAEFGKQHNSTQEAQIAWAGIHLWGKATGRKPLADLGQFLYTLGAYSNDAYFNGTLGQLTPDVSAGEFVADYSADGTFLPRATASVLNNNGACWNINDAQTLVSNGRGLSAWQTQPFTNFTPGTALPFLTAGVYQGRQWYQGEFGVEPLNALANLVLPLEPMTLSTLRDTAYMSNLAAATLNGGQSPFYNASYAGVLNKLFAAVGLKQSASARYSEPSAQTLPLPCANPASWPPEIDFNKCGAFRTLDTAALNVAATDWYWNAYTSGNGKVRPTDDKSPAYTPWQGQAVADAPTDCDKLKLDDYFTTPSDGAGSFVDYHYFDAYGAPEFRAYAEAVGHADQQPLGVAFRKGPVLHFVAYNPNDTAITVQFKTITDGDNPGADIGPASPSIPAHGSVVWSTGSQFGSALITHPRVTCNSLCFRSAQYFLNTPNGRPGGAVIVPGVNFNHPVSTNNTAVQLALRGGASDSARFSQQYVAAQLNLARAAATQSALQGNLSCYGLDFAPVRLTNGATLRPASRLGELFEQAQAALRDNRSADFAPLAALFQLLNGNDPLGRCRP